LCRHSHRPSTCRQTDVLRIRCSEPSAKPATRTCRTSDVAVDVDHRLDRVEAGRRRAVRRPCVAKRVELRLAANERDVLRVPDRRLGRDVAVDRLAVAGEEAAVDRVDRGPDPVGFGIHAVAD